MKPYRTPIALAMACLLSPSAFAWDDFGHMVVAASAYNQLKAKPQVRARVDSLVKLNPSYAQWVQDVPAARRGQVAFVMASRWADAIKSDSRYHNDGGANGDDPVEPVASQNIGYADKARHKYWHFKDIGFSPDGTPDADPKEPNVETTIERFRDTLKSKTASAALKSYDLVWLIHLVGDAHQPLHATSRFTKDLPAGDIGGNKVITSCSASCPGKLHAVWDDALDQGLSKAERESPDVAITFAGSLAAAPDSEARITDVAVWLTESFELAKAEVYKSPIGVAGKGPYSLDATYLENAKVISQKRVTLAAARLAKLIADALK